jgi:hypothetical protein
LLIVRQGEFHPTGSSPRQMIDSTSRIVQLQL